MKKLTIMAILAALFFLTVEGFTILGVKQAQCAWCPSFECYDHSTCNGCRCIKTGMNLGGVCMSIDRK